MCPDHRWQPLYLLFVLLFTIGPAIIAYNSAGSDGDAKALREGLADLKASVDQLRREVSVWIDEADLPEELKEDLKDVRAEIEGVLTGLKDLERRLDSGSSLELVPELDGLKEGHERVLTRLTRLCLQSNELCHVHLNHLTRSRHLRIWRKGPTPPTRDLRNPKAEQRAHPQPRDRRRTNQVAPRTYVKAVLVIALK